MASHKIEYRNSIIMAAVVETKEVKTFKLTLESGKVYDLPLSVADHSAVIAAEIKKNSMSLTLNHKVADMDLVVAYMCRPEIKMSRPTVTKSTKMTDAVNAEDSKWIDELSLDQKTSLTAICRDLGMEELQNKICISVAILILKLGHDTPESVSAFIADVNKKTVEAKETKEAKA